MVEPTVTADPFAGMGAIMPPAGVNSDNPLLFAPPGPVALASLAQAYRLVLAEAGAAVADAWAAPLVTGREAEWAVVLTQGA